MRPCSVNNIINKSPILVFVICCLLVFVNCKSTDCKITNEVFNKYAPDNKAYKDELVKQLQTMRLSEITFLVDGCWKKKDSGKTLCETAHWKADEIKRSSLQKTKHVEAEFFNTTVCDLGRNF